MADFLESGGNDDFTGSAADDVFAVSAGQDRVDGGGGFNRLTVDYRSDVNGTSFSALRSQGGGWTGIVGGNATPRQIVSFLNIQELVVYGSDRDNRFQIEHFSPFAADLRDNLLIDAGGGNDRLTLNAGGLGEPIFFAGSSNTMTAFGTFLNFEVFNLFGGDGADSLAGAGGNDSLYGGAGNDTLRGFAGNDLLESAGGVALLAGGDGDDYFRFTGIGAGTIVEGGAGHDEFGIDLFGTTAPVDFDLSGLAGGALQAAGLTLTGIEGFRYFGGGSGDDRLVLGNVYTGGSWLQPGAGNDWVAGSAGNDTLDGDAGNDTLFGLSGNDILTDGLGDDLLDGGSGDDSIASGAGTDTLIGGDGNDTINASFNMPDRTVFMYGGDGDDVFIVNYQGAVIFETAGGGHDRVASLGDFYLYAEIEDLEITDQFGFGVDAFGVGNELSNRIAGNSGQNLLIGLDGNDTIEGRGGNDALFGVVGNDSLNGDAGIDYLAGGEGVDTLDGGADPDALYGEDGDDSLVGGASFDTDILVGGAGRDTLNGASGLGDYDRLNGGAGDDLYFVDTPADLTFEAADGGTDRVVADIAGAGYYLYPHVENLLLRGATPFGVGNDLANFLGAEAGTQWLLGGAGDDSLDGGAGNDVLFGESGADVFVFVGASGADVIGDFTPGTDRIRLIGVPILDYAQLRGGFVENGGTTAIDLGDGNFIVLNGVANAALSAGDFIFG